MIAHSTADTNSAPLGRRLSGPSWPYIGFSTLAIAACIAGMVSLLAQRGDPIGHSFTGTCFVLLTIAAILHLLIVRRIGIVRTNDLVAIRSGTPHRGFLTEFFLDHRVRGVLLVRRLSRNLFLGASVSYLMLVALCPPELAGDLFMSMLGLWSAIVAWIGLRIPTPSRTLPSVCSPGAKLSSRGAGAVLISRLRIAVRHSHALLFWSAVSLSIAELGLRLYETSTEDSLISTEAPLTMTPGLEVNGRRVNAAGFWDEEFSRDPALGKFRIAVIGSSLTLSGTAATNCISQLEARLPACEVYHFGTMNVVDPRQYAMLLQEHVLRYRPNLVLMVISPTTDLADVSSTSCRFDRRSLRVWQTAERWLSSGSPSCIASSLPRCNAQPEHTRDLQKPQQMLDTELAVCRTPVDPATRDRWRATFEQLGGAVEICRQARLPVAVVVAPGPCQISQVCRESLCRKLGYDPATLDLELPQRSMMTFALEQQVPMLDLLPVLRSRRESPYCRDSRGFSESGHRVAADALARFVQSRYGSSIAAMAER